MSKPRRGFEVLGSAPVGFNCGLCGRSGSELQFMSHGRIGLFHCDCAQEFFGAPVEPMKPKVAAVLDREIVNEKN